VEIKAERLRGAARRRDGHDDGAAAR
jgi:hypothetical protein